MSKELNLIIILAEVCTPRALLPIGQGAFLRSETVKEPTEVETSKSDTFFHTHSPWERAYTINDSEILC